MSPTARPFLEDASNRLNLWLIGDGNRDIADVYSMACAADSLKISHAHPRNKCSYCGQYGKYKNACEYCGATIE